MRTLAAMLTMVFPWAGAAAAVVHQPCTVGQSGLHAGEPHLLRLAIGCEIEGCCPHCDQRESIALTLQLVGPDKAAAEVRIQAPSADSAATAGAQWRRESMNVYRLHAGESLSLRGFAATAAEPVQLEARLFVMHTMDGAHDDAPAVLHVIQELGGRRLRAESVVMSTAACAAPLKDAPRDDVVAVWPPVAVSAVVSWRPTACDAPRALRAGNPFFVSKRDDTCPGEIAVFAPGFRPAVLLDPPRGAGPLLHTAQLGEVSELAIANWVMHNDQDTWSKRLATAICAGNSILRSAGAGIRVVQQDRMFLQDPQVAQELRTAWCDKAQQLKRVAHSRTALNVYHLNRERGDGHFCSDNFIAVSLCAPSDVLAHEIGHALSLPHFKHDPRNVMTEGASGRTALTVGQVYRMNFHEKSSLQQFSSNRPPLAKRCENLPAGTPSCPDATLRAVEVPAAAALAAVPVDASVAALAGRLECIECDEPEAEEARLLDVSGTAQLLRTIAERGLAPVRRIELTDTIGQVYDEMLEQGLCAAVQVESREQFLARELALKDLHYRARAVEELQRLRTSGSRAVRGEALEALRALRASNALRAEGPALRDDDPFALRCSPALR